MADKTTSDATRSAAKQPATAAPEPYRPFDAEDINPEISDAIAQIQSTAPEPRKGMHPGVIALIGMVLVVTGLYLLGII